MESLLPKQAQISRLLLDAILNCYWAWFLYLTVFTKWCHYIFTRLCECIIVYPLAPLIYFCQTFWSCLLLVLRVDSPCILLPVWMLNESVTVSDDTILTYYWYMSCTIFSFYSVIIHLATLWHDIHYTKHEKLHPLSFGISDFSSVVMFIDQASA